MIRSPKLFIIDSSLVKEILVTNFKHFNKNDLNAINEEKNQLFGHNPFFFWGQKWKDERGVVTPAFTSSRNKAIYPIIEDVCVKLANYLKSGISDGFNGKDLCERYTAEAISSCVFGIDANSFLKEKSEIHIMGNKLIDDFFQKFGLATILSTFPILNKIQLSYSEPDVEQFLIQLMKDSVKYRTENKIERSDFMQYMIQLKEKKPNMTDIEFTSHAISFFSDGFGTTSTAISHVFYNLASNKSVQDKLRDEIRKNILKTGSVDYDTLSEMNYLDQTFNESIRLNPVLGSLVKACTESIEVKNSDGKSFLIEEGTAIYIPVYSIHMDPEYYPEPKQFKPERFDPENGGIKAFKDKGVFLGFGDGPRTCLGSKIATMISKAVIVHIVNKFEITVNKKTIEPLELDPKALLLVPKGGIWLDFKEI